jgi:hypothetical protein
MPAEIAGVLSIEHSFVGEIVGTGRVVYEADV